MYMLNEIKITPNVLSREQCAKIIEDAKNYERDFLKKDLVRQSEFYDRETLDKNTVERSVDDSYGIRKVSQSPINDPVFPEWDGYPVYRCKVMKYEEGDFLAEHRDAQWMCLSNYWKPDTNKISQSLISIALNDDFEGGEFTVEGKVVLQPVGTAITVPQHALDHSKSLRHGVRKVTKGTRYALVFWNFG